MRTKVFIGLVIVVAIVVVALLLLPRRPRVGPWKLPDGSELSLAGVTYGKNHAMRYGDRLVDYLYPILPDSLRRKFGCKVLTVPWTGTNGVVVWLWDKGVAAPTPAIYSPLWFDLTVEDEHGMNSWFPEYPVATTVWNKTNILHGFVLGRFPRRSRSINIDIHPIGPFVRSGNLTNLIAKFTVPNRTHTNYPVWTASALPATVKTNGIEVSLVDFEMLPLKKGTSLNNFRFGFSMPENVPGSNHVALRHISARSATGEFYDSAVAAQPAVSRGRTTYANLMGPLWEEEPAWIVTAEFWRTMDFPPDELWTVKGIALPGAKRTQELHLTTNIYGSEIEMMTITGGWSNTNDWTGKIARVPAMLRVSSPIPALETHLRLVEVRDDHGRPVNFEMDEETLTTGGRGATIRQSEKDYALEFPDDAKSVDVTLAYTKSFAVEFLAKPTMGKEDAQK